MTLRAADTCPGPCSRRWAISEQISPHSQLPGPSHPAHEPAHTPAPGAAAAPPQKPPVLSTKPLVPEAAALVLVPAA